MNINILNTMLNTFLIILFIPIYIIGIPIAFLSFVKENQRDPDIFFWIFGWPLIFIAKSFSARPTQK